MEEPILNTNQTSVPTSSQTNPNSPINSNKPKIFFIGFVIFSILIAFIAGGFILRKPLSIFDAYKSPIDIVKPQKPCTMEAKICPDGSSVGRSGPNCEFAPCPKTSLSPSPFTNETANWKLYTFKPLNLSLEVPPELTVQTEEPNQGKDFVAYIQNYAFNAPLPKNNTYQLYIIWQKSTPISEAEFQELKNELNPNSVENITIAGFPAIKGQLKGERNRFATYILKDSNKISIFTSEPTEVNKKITDQILSTFKFTNQTQTTIVPSPRTNKTINIPPDWKSYTAEDSDWLGIKTTMSMPPGFSFFFTGSEFNIQNSDATELWDYSTSVFAGKDGLKNYYNDISRRVWYQSYLNGDFMPEKPYQFTPGKIINTTEHQINNNSYYELTVSGEPPTNYVGNIGKHFIYVQNGILHIIKPASEKSNSSDARIPSYIGTIFSSLSSTQVK